MIFGRLLKSSIFQAAQKCPDARPLRRFSPADQAGNPEE
jgi:hypothetical protein